MNLFRGCTHGCIYCDSRSKCYWMKHKFEDVLDDTVSEVIVKLVSNPKFANMMKKQINMKVDTKIFKKVMSKKI